MKLPGIEQADDRSYHAQLLTQIARAGIAEQLRRDTRHPRCGRFETALATQRGLLAERALGVSEKDGYVFEELAKTYGR